MCVRPGQLGQPPTDSILDLGMATLPGQIIWVSEMFSAFLRECEDPDSA